MTKSNSKWLREGDKNTSFFINQVTSRRINNKIKQLYMEGTLVYGIPALQEHIVSSYENLFKEEKLIRIVLRYKV